MIFFAGNLFAGIAQTVYAPSILAHTHNSSIILGTVQSTLGIAGVAGGLLMTAWGGFKRRVYGVLLGWSLTGIFMFLFGFGRSLAMWIPAGMLMILITPLINASNQAIWQAKVAPDLQGRVFSARRLIAWFTNPISPIIAGTLSDFVLEPAMKTQSGLSHVFGGLFGIGPGSGMGLLISIGGLASAMVGLVGYLIPAIRNAEDILPDHDKLEVVVANAEAQAEATATEPSASDTIESLDHV